MDTTSILKKLSASKNKKGMLIGGAGALGMAIPFTRNLIMNELLGVDDFKRALKYADEGEFSKMLKSLAAGGFELGSTMIPSGALIKGARAGKLAAEVAPVGGRIVGRIPGLTSSGMLTPQGLRALQGFRAAETVQMADAGNALSQGFLNRGFNVGSAQQISRQQAEAEMRRRLLAYLGGSNAL